MNRIFLLLLFFIPAFCIAQNVTVNITLNAVEGGVHSFMEVSLVDTTTKATFKGKTDGNGKAAVSVPANAVYDLLIPNYTARKLVKVPNAPGATMSTALFYSRTMKEEEKAFAMNDAEKGEVDRFTNALPDTTWFNGTDPFLNYSETYYSSVELELTDFDKGPLSGETVTLIGRKSKKGFKGVTDGNGKVKLYLPKGDNYDLSFFYHKNFEYTECKYSKGISEIHWSFGYIGTKNYARKKKEEEERIIAEAKRQEEERKAWEEELRRSKMSAIDQRKEEMNDYESGKKQFSDKAAIDVLTRNSQWKNKLIVCDVTGSMYEFMAQVMLWFKNDHFKDPGAQFVFFNDAEAKHVLGQTKNWFYSTPPIIDTLITDMVGWAERGSGGEVRENDIEALVMAAKTAKKPFDELVLIADNQSPVIDMQFMDELLALKKPVHVILCGSESGFIEPDYLAIAWKTKGTVHTAAEDYTNIANLKDGETIKVGTTNYRLMKGEFIPM